MWLENFKQPGNLGRDTKAVLGHQDVVSSQLHRDQAKKYKGLPILTYQEAMITETVGGVTQ